MARQCMRPGCDRLAAARLTYDTAAGAVWLDPPVDDGQPAQQVCDVHAATLTAPLGWTMTDRRFIEVGASRYSLSPPVIEGEVSPFAQARRAARSEEPGTFTQQTLEIPDDGSAQSPTGVAAVGAPGSEAPRSEVPESHAPETDAPETEAPGPEAPRVEGPESEVPPADEPEVGEAPGKPGTKPRGKLLDRAFEWTGPQHSVLTTGPGKRRQQSSES